MDYNNINQLLNNLSVDDTKTVTPNKRVNNVKTSHQGNSNQGNSNQWENNRIFGEQFLIKNDFNSSFNQNTDSSSDKLKNKSVNENLFINRNNETINFSNMNIDFNYESFNPQRQSILNQPINIESDNKQNSNFKQPIDPIQRNLESRSIGRVNDEQHPSRFLGNDFGVKSIDYSQFSENFRDYKKNVEESVQIKNGSEFDSESINNKLNSREQIPNILSVPKNLWDN